MDLKEIATEWLKEKGYDGLYSQFECGCDLSDLMPCDEPHPDCKPGYKVKCPKGHEFNFMITEDPNDTNCDSE